MRCGGLPQLLAALQAAVGDFDDVGIGHAGEEIVKLGRGHHVRDHSAGQAKLAASLGGRGGGEKLVGGPFRDVLHEGRGYLGPVEGGGRVVDPLPDLVLRRTPRDAFGAYDTSQTGVGAGVQLSLETFRTTIRNNGGGGRGAVPRQL